MLQSMFSGISGLRTHQARMDVIGNDIANVNTPGYKQSEVTFQEAYVKTISSASPGTPGRQVGLGAQVGAISRNFDDGILMETGMPANLGLAGDGFFVVKPPANAIDNKLFSRAGDFLMDVDDVGNTYIINPNGYRLQGLMGDPAPDLNGVDVAALADIVLPPNTTSFSVGLDGTLFAAVGEAFPAEVGRVAVARFDNKNGLDSVGNNVYQQTEASRLRALTNAGAGGTAEIYQGYLENSNVDLAREFTEMIVTQRGFQANSKCITTSDELLQELLTLKR
jgi:flagellar hook protein FlgE